MAMRFDPTNSVQFDLTHGQIRGGGQVRAGDSLHRLLIGADALERLYAGADAEARRDFGRRLGHEVGRRAADALAQDLTQASVELVLEHIGGQWALLGLGVLGVERWGRALVFTVTESPLSAESDELLASVVEGALRRAWGRAVMVVRLGREADVVRLLVTGEAGARRVQELLAQGGALADVLTVLNRVNAGTGEA